MSKQTINKAERFEIIAGLVVASTKKTGNTLMKLIVQTRKDTEAALLDNFCQHVPELSRSRIAELRQAHVLQPASLRNATVYGNPDRKGSNYLFQYSWGRDKMVDARKDMQSTLMRRCTNSWAGDGLDITTGAWNIELIIDSKFPAVPCGFSSGVVCHPDDPKPQINMHLNNFLHATHYSSRTILSEVEDLLRSAWDMFETLEAQLGMVKSVDVLLKLIPEASKHLPDSLKQAKATKELADPTAINEIREKLKAGLPI